MRHRKPFAVVPCCVFPAVFPERMLRMGPHGGTQVQVRSREQLCQWLAAMHPSIRVELVPGIPPPCNTVVYCAQYNDDGGAGGDVAGAHVPGPADPK